MNTGLYEALLTNEKGTTAEGTLTDALKAKVSFDSTYMYLYLTDVELLFLLAIL